MCFSPHHYHPTPAGGQPARPPASQPASQPPVEPRECVSWASVSVLSGLYDRHRQAEDKGVRLLMFRSFGSRAPRRRAEQCCHEGRRKRKREQCHATQRTAGTSMQRQCSKAVHINATLSNAEQHNANNITERNAKQHTATGVCLLSLRSLDRSDFRVSGDLGLKS